MYGITYLDDTVDTRSEEGGRTTSDTDRFLIISLITTLRIFRGDLQRYQEHSS